MTHTFLSVFAMSKGKQSLSCNDIPALTTIKEHRDQLDIKQRRNSRPEELFRPKFLRPKSPLLHSSKSKSRNSSHALDDLDRQLVQIKQKLSIFREQDMEFRERLDSLSYSIDELASRSSIASNLSEASIDSDLVFEQNDDANSTNEELDYEDDLSIENEIKNISTSFSDEVLSRIPVISVSPDDEELNYEDDLSIENQIKNISTSFSDEVLSRIPIISVTPDDILPSSEARTRYTGSTVTTAKYNVHAYLFNQSDLTVPLPTY